MPRVYGKQIARPNAAALCFAASSSPSKSDRNRTSDAQSTLSASTPDRGSGDFVIHASQSSEDLREISDAFVQQVARLTLDQSPKERPRRRTALSARDANTSKLHATEPSKQQIIDDSKHIAAQLQKSLRRRRDSEAHDSGLASSSPVRILDNLWEPDKPTGVVVAIPISPSLSAEKSAKSCEPEHAEPSPEDCEPDTWTYIRPLLTLIHDPAAAQGPISFSSYAESLTEHLSISKIAEASFGEVYRLSLAHPEPMLSDTAESVLKIIALKPDSLTASPSGRKWTKIQRERIESMSAPADVASEARLLQRMRDVPGFANFRSLLIARGALPAPFLAAWRHYDAHIKASEFPDPGARGNGYLGDDQLWAVLEMEDAGDDLEDKPVPDIWTLWDVFWGVALALAKGEEWAGYEHRDLHLGNVCVRRPPCHPVIDVTRKLGFTGLETTLIDYTLSRANLCDVDTDLDSAAETGSNQRDDIAFFDLSTDPAIFRGDASEEYQYEIYRHMRGAVLSADPCATASPVRPAPKKQKSGARRRNRARPSLDAALAPPEGDKSAWRAHTPLTNLVWLHFVLYKLSEQLDAWPSAAKRGRGRGRKKRSAEESAVHEAALALEGRVGELTDALALEELVPGELGSAAGLVTWAVEQGWLDEADVLGAEGVGEEASFLSIVQGVRNVKVGDEEEERDASDVVLPGRRGRRA